MPWPKFDEALAREDEIEVPVQINGKLRAVIKVPVDAPKEALEAAAGADEKVQAAACREDGREGDRGAGQAHQLRGPLTWRAVRRERVCKRRPHLCAVPSRCSRYRRSAGAGRG